MLSDEEWKQTFQGVRSALDRFDAEGREPDHWEALHLAYVIQYLELRSPLAVGELQEALLPPDKRSAFLDKAIGEKPRLHTKATLRKDLLAVTG